MAWWEWIIMLGLWGWVMNELSAIRRWTLEEIGAINQRNREDLHELRYDIQELNRAHR